MTKALNKKYLNKFILVIVVLLLVIFAIVIMKHLFYAHVLGINLLKYGKPVSINELVEYNKSLGSKKDIFYRIKPEYYNEIGKGTFPKVKLYKENKELDVGDCYGDLPYIIEKYSNVHDSIILKKDMTPIQDELKKIITIDGEKVKFTNPEKYKYTLIYYYALWSHGMNKKKLKPLIERYSKTDSIKLFIVNCDTIN